MNKFMLQDIKMIKRESEPTHEGVARKILEDYKTDHNKSGGSRGALWAIAGVSLVVLAFAVSFLFTQAKVVVTPKTQTVTLDNSAYTAVKNATDAGTVGFQYVNFSGEESATIPATDPKQVSEKAHGTITIFNTFSAQTQKLIVGTRFETPDGKIYKMDKEVTVPGMKTVAGKSVPGSVSVAVTASEPGESYNIGLTDFTIPGFKSDAARYAKFYARSETPMSGGATGVLNSASSADYTQASNSLDQVLKDKLVSQVKAQIPKGYVLLDGAVSFVPEASAPNLFSKTNSLTIVKRGTINAILFDEKALAAKIAKDTISQYAGEEVTMANANDLTLALKDTAASFNQDTTEVSFTLSGSPRIVWVVDEEKLKEDLAGQSKKEFRNVLKNYTGIESAEVVLKPFWRMSFPEKAESITVEEVSVS